MADDASDHTTRKPAERAAILILTLVAAMAAAGIYEVSQQFVSPPLDPWQSHLLNVVVTGGIATLTGFLLMRQQEAFVKRSYGALNRESAILNRTLAQLHQISQYAPGMVFQFRLGPDGAMSFTYVSEGCVALTGRQPAEIVGDATKILNLIHREDWKEFERSLKLSAKSLTRWAWEGMLNPPIAKFKWVQLTSMPVGQPDGSILWNGVITDMTEQKMTEEELLDIQEAMEARIAERTREVSEVNSFLRNVLDSNPSLIYVKDYEGRFTLVNEAVARLYGTSVDELTGKFDSDFNANPDEVQRFLRDDRRVMDTQTRLVTEEQITDSEGDNHWLKTVKLPIVSQDWQSRQVLGVSVDITHAKRAEREIRDLNAQLAQNLAELSEAYETTIEAWAQLLDLRDKETEGHTRRVTDMCVRLARAMGVSDDELIDIRRGALLHDIGKMGIPDEILLKPGPLDDREWVIMRRHPDYAYQCLSRIPFLKKCIDIPYGHHEKWDGSGYPRGLAGEDIPIAARMFAVVDVWDALRSDRPYRAGWSHERVMSHIASLSGTHFDPEAVEAFLSIADVQPAASAA